MSFLGDLFQAAKKTAEQHQTAYSGVSESRGIAGGGKKPECTPCAASAYVDGLRDSVNGKKKPTRRRKRK